MGAELKAVFEQEKKKFTAQGGVMKRKREEGNDGGKPKKAPRDENKPKKPTGGAWGVFLNENRAKIMKELPQGFRATDISKEAGKRWKALSEAEQKPFQEKYVTVLEAYKEAMQNYKPSAAAEAGGDDEEDEEDEEDEA